MEKTLFRRAMDTLPRKYRFAANHSLLHNPHLGKWYVKNRPAFQYSRITKETDLVVDGFPRSANTYAMYALRHALGPAKEVRGHTHAASTLLTAAEHGIPAMVVIRPPKDSVASLLQMVDGLTPTIAFNAYRRFHDALAEYRTDIYFAHFDEVVTDFGESIANLNSHFGTNFRPYIKTDASESAIMGKIEEANRVRNSGQIREAGVARPSAARKSATELLASLSNRETHALKRAEDSYNNLAGSRRL